MLLIFNTKSVKLKPFIQFHPIKEIALDFAKKTLRIGIIKEIKMGKKMSVFKDMN